MKTDIRPHEMKLSGVRTFRHAPHYQRYESMQVRVSKSVTEWTVAMTFRVDQRLTDKQPDSLFGNHIHVPHSHRGVWHKDNIFKP